MVVQLIPTHPEVIFSNSHITFTFMTSQNFSVIKNKLALISHKFHENTFRRQMAKCAVQGTTTTQAIVIMSFNWSRGSGTHS